MGGMSAGGPPAGDTSQQAANKVQKVKSLDVWEALRNSLKKGDDGKSDQGKEKGGQNDAQNV